MYNIWISGVGPRTFETLWELLWYNCSLVCELPARQLYNGANGYLFQESLCNTLCLPGLLLPRPCGRLQLTHGSSGDPQTLKGRSGSVYCGGYCSFPRVLVHTRYCLCPPSITSGYEVWFLNAIAPLLLSCCCFSFALGCRVLEKQQQSACLRLLMFLLAVLIPACDSSSLEFCMMYHACKLNQQGDNIQPWCTPFPILKNSLVPCLVLTVGFLLAYMFLRRQVRWSGIPIFLRIFQCVVIYIVKGFSVVNEADIFMEFSCFFYDPKDVRNLILRALSKFCFFFLLYL